MRTFSRIQPEVQEMFIYVQIQYTWVLTSHDLEAGFRVTLTFTEIEICAKYFQNRTKDMKYGDPDPYC